MISQTPSSEAPEKPIVHSDQLDEMKETCRSLAEVTEGETHKLAAKLWELGFSYMDDVRARAKRSFFSALVIAVLGIGFFFAALWLMMTDQMASSKLTLIAGVSIQIVSGIGFYLYARTAKEFFAFHVCLERANRYLLANTICQNLEQPLKDKMRSELILIIASAPALSASLVERGESSVDKVEAEASTT